MRNIEKRKQEIMDEQRRMLDVVQREDRDFTPAEEKKYDAMDREWSELEKRQRAAEEEEFAASHATGLVYHDTELGTESRSGNSGIRHSGVFIGEYRVEDMKRYVDSRGYGWSDGTTRRASNRKYLRLGLNGLREEETRDLQMDIATAGGYAVQPVEMLMEYLVDLNEIIRFRTLARTELVEHAHSLRIADVIDPAVPQWGEELSAGATDTTMGTTAREWNPHPLALELKVSKKLVRARPDIDNLIRERTTEKMSQALEEAYMTGTGSNMPLGIFTASSMGIPTSQDITTATTGAVKGDDLYNVKKTLKAQYRRGARWFCSREFEYRVSTLKTGEGAYMFQPSLAGNTPGTLLGYPLEVSEFASGSNWASGDYVAVLGNPKKYLIADAMTGFQIQVLIELYASQNMNAYHVRMESDGNITDPNAWVRLKLK